MANKNLHHAKNAKNDEFYTCYDDIARELNKYAKYFKNKVIYCNCDDHNGIDLGTPKSNFLKYFADNFESFGITKLIATHYEKDKQSTMYVLDSDITGDGIVCGEDIMEKPLNGDGDFRSSECIELLKQADIVITNPPFSLFREYIAQLIEYNKKFIIIGNQNAITYKEIFPLIKNNKIWLGYGFPGGATHFINEFYTDYATSSNHKEGMIRVSGVVWFTNLPTTKRNEKLETGKIYYGYENMYPKYDNYDAIEVSKVSDIPMDYDGAMGVPITFLDKFNPNQFEILGCSYSYGEPIGYHKENSGFGVNIGKKDIYKRLFIRKKKDD